MTTSGTLLVVVDDPIAGKTEGGVQFLVRELLRGAHQMGVESIVATTDTVVDVLTSHPADSKIVFIQKGGRLSPSYKVLATAWLALGAHVIEQNIFAQPSSFRPRHNNYHLALMSHDGAFRFSWRSSVTMRRGPRHYLFLPNPGLQAPASRSEPSPSELVFLRVGRPDPIKWTDFEVRFCEMVAKSLPDGRSVRLVRVGHPGGSKLTTMGRLVVDDLAYGADLGVQYGKADFYLHHSRIGETFGHTVAEAVRSELPVILAVDLDWDAASVELLAPRRNIYGSPSGLVRHAPVIVRTLEDRTARSSPSAPPPVVSLSTVQFVRILCDVAQGKGAHLTMLPAPTEFVGHVRSLRAGMFDRPLFGSTRGVFVETARAIKNWNRRDN